MKLMWVYKGDMCFNAPTDFIENQGMVVVWEEKKYFVVIPTKIIPGRGETTDCEKRKPQILLKKDGWEGIYETGRGVY